MKVMVMTPTYNERENIQDLLSAILSLTPQMDVVVVDDDSPDKTWEVVDTMRTKDSRVRLLRRKSERGRGFAGIAGFRYALEHGADVVVEMDADFSHDPTEIPRLLEKIGDADVVLGSRFVPGGRQVNRPFHRRLLTRCAILYIKAVLGFRVKDPTSGFRCFTRKALEALRLETLKAQGPFVVTEVLYRCHRRGLRMTEVPITFREREKGTTKISVWTLMNNLIEIPRLRCRRESPLTLPSPPGRGRG